MADATFDGPNLLITLPAPVGGALTVLVGEEIYSAWKEWVKVDGHQYEPAFDVTGGDPIPGSQFISGSWFLRNDLGWRIQSTDEDQDVSFIGNLVDFLTDFKGVLQRLFNREYVNPVTNKLEQYDDTSTSILFSADIWEDDGVTPWDGVGPIRRRDRME